MPLPSSWPWAIAKVNMVTARSYPSYPDQTWQYATSSSRTSQRFFDLPFGHSTGDRPRFRGLPWSSEVIDKPMDPHFCQFWDAHVAHVFFWLTVRMRLQFPMGLGLRLCCRRRVPWRFLDDMGWQFCPGIPWNRPHGMSTMADFQPGADLGHWRQIAAVRWVSHRGDWHSDRVANTRIVISLISLSCQTISNNVENISFVNLVLLFFWTLTRSMTIAPTKNPLVWICVKDSKVWWL